MTNAEKLLQMHKEASRVYFYEDKAKGEKLDFQAKKFAEENFTEEDFDEYIATRSGLEKSMIIEWKNNVLKKRANKKTIFSFNNQFRY